MRTRRTSVGATLLAGLCALSMSCGTQASRSICGAYADYVVVADIDASINASTVGAVNERAEQAETIVRRMLATADDKLRTPLDDLLVALDNLRGVLGGVDSNETWQTVAPLVEDSVEDLLDANARIRAALDPECLPRTADS